MFKMEQILQNFFGKAKPSAQAADMADDIPTLDDLAAGGDGGSSSGALHLQKHLQIPYRYFC